jgi:Phage tail tube protein
MAKGIGRLVQVGIAKETTRGTAISSAAYWNPWNDLTLDEKKEFATDAQAYGIVEDNVNFTQTKKWAQGSLAGNFLDQSSGLLLYSMFGGYAVGTHSGETVVYDHTFSIGESAQHQSLTFFLHDPLSTVDYSYANGVVEKLELNIALKKFIEFTATLKTLSGAPQSSFTPSTTSENRFVPQYLAAKFALNYAGLQGTLTATGTAASSVHVTGCSINPQTNLKVGMGVSGTNIPVGATVAKIISSTAYDLSVATTGAIGTQTFTPVAIALKSAKITINANVEDQDVLGNLNPADFLNKEFSVEGTMEAIYQNESDFKAQFMGPYPLSIRLDIKNTDVTLGSTTNPELFIDMPKCTIQELGRPFKVKDLVYQTIKFKASYSVSDTLMAKMVLTNTVSTY